MSEPSSQREYTLQNESQRIFNLIVQDKRLALPDEVKGLAHTVRFVGDETRPFFPVPIKCTEAHAGLVGAVGLLANAITKARYGIEQEVQVDVDHAMLAGIAACFIRHDGQWMASSKAQNAVVKRWDHGQTREMYRQLGTNIYQTKDGRWFQLHGSMNPTPLLTMLGLPQHDDKDRDFMEIVEMYQNEIRKYDSETLQHYSNNVYRTPGTTCYERDEFLALPQGLATKDEPYYKLSKPAYYTQPPTAWPSAHTDDPRPLSGIKVLDLSRAIAAPTVGKFCASLGATVVRVGCESLCELPMTLIDGCTDKISVDINLKKFEGRKKLMELIQEADVFVDGYRPATLEHLGFGKDAVLGLCAQRDKGIVYLQENCYGWHGPWSTRAGWAQIADSVSGISLEIGRFHGFNEAQIFPGPNADYLTGHAGVLGILHALIQRNRYGGSYVVQCSLLASNMQLLSYGGYSEEQLDHLRKRNSKTVGQIRHYDEILSQARVRYTNAAFVADRTEECMKKEFFQTVDGSPWGLGPLELVTTPLKMSKTRTDFRLGASPPGYHLPQWTVARNTDFQPLPQIDMGRAIVDLPYGDINPCGRLTYTVVRAAEVCGHLVYVSKRQGTLWRFPQSYVDGGVNIDYRPFDAHGIEPLYEFGFGLSYTTFQYAHLQISRHDGSPSSFPPVARVEQRGNPHLWDEIAALSATLTNAGRIDGSEVAQLYVGIPGGPVRQLRGFEKVYIPAAERIQVAFPLARRDLSVWDVARQDWWLQRGDYKLYVGRSSRDIALQGTLHIN